MHPEPHRVTLKNGEQLIITAPVCGREDYYAGRHPWQEERIKV